MFSRSIAGQVDVFIVLRVFANQRPRQQHAARRTFTGKRTTQ